VSEGRRRRVRPARPYWRHSLSAARRSLHSIRFDFLASPPFRCEDPDSEHWISLDFLGFSRPNRDFSMGYTGFSLEEISRALLPQRRGRPGKAPAFLGMQKRRIIHLSSLAWFLILCKELLST
jgi:hypothetical protein